MISYIIAEINFFSQFSDFSGFWYPLSGVGLYLAILLIIAEGVNRLTSTDSEVTRKIVHIGSGHVILLAWWLNIAPWVIIVASVIASIIAVISYFMPILPSINSVGRPSLGTFFYAVSIGVLVAGFWQLGYPQYVAVGILVMAWGDGMAAIIGQHFGKHPYTVAGMTKSWEGSLTMLGVSWLVTGLILGFVTGYSGQVGLISLGVALVATGLESFSRWGIDNLTVPLGSAIVAFWLSQALL